MSNNFHFDVSSEGRRHFEMVMEIAFQHWSHKEAVATHYWISDEKGLVLYWGEESSNQRAQKLPYPMGREAATQFAWNWLATADYGREPDHDGSNHKGWRIYNESWARVGSDWTAFVAIQPCWMMYGK